MGVTPSRTDHVLVDLADRHGRAVTAYQSGDLKGAVAVFEEVLAGCRSHLGAEHVATLTVAGNLGVALVAAGRRREGITVLATNVADRARVCGEDDPRTLVARDALAVGRRLAGQVDEAVALSGQVTEQRRRILGPTHLDTLTSRMGLALAQAAAGDVGAAVTVLTAAISESEQAHGSRHPHTTALIESGRRIGLLRRSA